MILLIGIQPIPAIWMGMVDPPLGNEYDAYFVTSLQSLFDTTIVSGGTAVYLFRVSPVLEYWRVYSPAATLELAAMRRYVFCTPKSTVVPSLWMKLVAEWLVNVNYIYSIKLLG